jgi:hypothetical protein
MLQSILNDDIQYLQNKKVSKNDIGTKVSVYDVELFDVNVAICLGEVIDTFVDKLIYYCPVYLIIKKINVERIGYFEFYKQELSTITDKDGDIDISLLEGPLLFNYIDSDYLVNKVSKDQFIKKFILEEEEFNKLTLEKSKTKKKELGSAKTRDKQDGKEDEGVDPAASAAISSSVRPPNLETKGGDIYNDVNNIPNINTIKLNGDKKINNELLNASEEQSKKETNSYKKNDNEPWVQTYCENNNFIIKDVESNGDCFFATLREAFKKKGVIVNVATLRNILSRNVSQEDYKFNKTIYNDTVQILKKYQKKYKKIKSDILEKTKEKNELLKIASKLSKDERRKITSKGTQIENINKTLLILETEKTHINKAFNLSNEIYKSKKFMKSVKSFEDYLNKINTTDYWADELAISLLEFLFNIKVIILSEENFDGVNDRNVINCGTTILTPIEKRGEFNPKYYIIVNHTGNHYKLILYNGEAMLNFYELPHKIRKDIKTYCPKALFKFIPLFKAYFGQNK